MTDFKVSQLTTAVPAAADLLLFVDVDDTSTAPAGAGGSDKATTVANLLGLTSGGFLCTPTQYAPGVRATPSTSSATMAAVDSTHISTGSFTAPVSGSVIITASFVFLLATGGDVAAFGLAAHGTVTPMIGNIWQFTNNGGQQPANLNWLVTGLTTGTSYNFDLMFASPNAVALTIDAESVTSTTPGGTNGAPVLMTVQAV